MAAPARLSRVSARAGRHFCLAIYMMCHVKARAGPAPGGAWPAVRAAARPDDVVKGAMVPDSGLQMAGVSAAGKVAG